MLGNEHGVAAHGRLLAVIVQMRRCKALVDDLPGLRLQHITSSLPHIATVHRSKRKALTIGQTTSVNRSPVTPVKKAVQCVG